MATGKVPASVKRYVRQVVSSSEETKIWSTDISITASSLAYGYANLLNVPQSVAANNRVGNKIRVKKVRVHLFTRPGDNYNTTRLLIWKTPFAADASTSTVLSSLPGAPAIQFNPYLKTDKWLVPKFVAVDGNTANQAEDQPAFYADFDMDLLVQYASGSTSIPINCAIGLQFHSDSAAIPNPGLYGYVSVYFTDA